MYVLLWLWKSNCNDTDILPNVCMYQDLYNVKCVVRRKRLWCVWYQLLSWICLMQWLVLLFFLYWNVLALSFCVWKQMNITLKRDIVQQVESEMKWHLPAFCPPFPFLPLPLIKTILWPVGLRLHHTQETLLSIYRSFFLSEPRRFCVVRIISRPTRWTAVALISSEPDEVWRPLMPVWIAIATSSTFEYFLMWFFALDWPWQMEREGEGSRRRDKNEGWCKENGTMQTIEA